MNPHFSARNRGQSPPIPLPSGRHWVNSSRRAQETIERHVEAHEQHCLQQLGGRYDHVPPLADLVAHRLCMADPNIIVDSLAELPPVFLQNNIWKWHPMPYTVLRQTILRLLYNGDAEGVEWDQSTSTGLHSNIDEWYVAARLEPCDEPIFSAGSWLTRNGFGMRIRSNGSTV